MSRILLSLVFVLALSANALAGAYVVGVEAINYYPLYAGVDGDYKGAAREILDAFAADAGHTFTYEPLPVARLFETYLTTDELDMKFPDNPYWSGDAKKGKNVVYSEPVVDYIDGVMVLPANKGKGAEALKTLGIIRGFTAWDYLDKIKAGQISLDESNDYEAMLKKAVKGRTDGAYSSVAVANYHVENTLGQKGALVFDEGLPHTRGSYFLSSIKHPELVEAFSAWMAKNAAKVQEIKNKYGAEQGVN